MKSKMISFVKKIVACWIVLISFTCSKDLCARENWVSIQEKSHNTVVQVVAQVGAFNWLQPYKVRKQVEVRGSGFFIDEEGHFITNAHVVWEAKRVWVHLPFLGKKPIHADIVGFSPERDLALLRIKQESRDVLREALGKIPFLSFGDSDKVRRTDNVLILGYPLGQNHLKSATGIISGREFLGGQSLIQTTAPINAGNSGGPLLNERGKVIGINTAAVAIAENVGYSIPINELKIILDDLFKTPLLRKPYLGILFNYSSDFQAKFFDNPVPGGLYINKVFKKSLAEKIGLQEGDVLYEFNGHKVDVYGDSLVPWNPDKVPIQDLISRLKLGQEVHLVIYRNGEKKELTFTFELSPVYPIRTMYPDYEKIDYEIIGGMIIMQLVNNHLPYLERKSRYLVKYEKMENKIDPVLVITYILHGSESYQMRTLFQGDILTSINGKEVKTLDELRKVLHEGIPTNSLRIKTSENVFVTLPLKKILEDEKHLSIDFGFPISSTVTVLLKKIQEYETKKAEKKA